MLLIYIALLGFVIESIGIEVCYIILAGLVLVCTLGTLVHTRERTDDVLVIGSSSAMSGDDESLDQALAAMEPFTWRGFFRDLITPFRDGNFRWVCRIPISSISSSFLLIVKHRYSAQGFCSLRALSLCYTYDHILFVSIFFTSLY